MTTIRTYDPHDCTTSGWQYRLALNGSASMTYRTRWQGSVTGTRWTRRDAPVLADVDEVWDLGERLSAALQDGETRCDGWRLASRGAVVR